MNTSVPTTSVPISTRDCDYLRLILRKAIDSIAHRWTYLYLSNSSHFYSEMHKDSFLRYYILKRPQHKWAKIYWDRCFLPCRVDYSTSYSLRHTRPAAVSRAGSIGIELVSVTKDQDLPIRCKLHTTTTEFSAGETMGILPILSMRKLRQLL